MPELEIGTVDGMQGTFLIIASNVMTQNLSISCLTGREKEAVVLSLVRSNDKARQSKTLER